MTDLSVEKPRRGFDRHRRLLCIEVFCWVVAVGSVGTLEPAGVVVFGVAAWLLRRARLNRPAQPVAPVASAPARVPRGQRRRFGRGVTEVLWEGPSRRESGALDVRPYLPSPEDLATIR